MSSGIIDLRSDTVTRPTPAMWDAMNRADVGDDVYGEDPNINALEEEAAALLGKEKALYVASGTMANQVALRAQTQPGDEVVAHPWAHIVRAESAGGAALAGVQFRPVGDPDGVLDPKEVEAVIQSGENPHFAPTTLLCLENTHNFSGGKVVPLENIEALAKVAAKHKLRMHLDGARMFNACVALDVKPETLVKNFNSVSFCLSKGLGAPVGSMIVGDADFIKRCYRFRKMYGGAMRQAGMLAAAGRYALKNHVARMAEDHENALHLAEGLREIKGIGLPRGMPQTNMVFFDCNTPKMNISQLVTALKEQGILVGHSTYGFTRAVTHLDVNRKQIDQTLKAVKELVSA